MSGAWRGKTTSPGPGSRRATGRRENYPSRTTSRPPARTHSSNSTSKKSPERWPSGWKELRSDGSSSARSMTSPARSGAPFPRRSPPKWRPRSRSMPTSRPARCWRTPARPRTKRGSGNWSSWWGASRRAWERTAAGRPGSTRCWAAWNAGRSRRWWRSGTTGRLDGGVRIVTGWVSRPWSSARYAADHLCR